MRILGLSAFYHDSAAALIEDGRVVAAAQEERFSRIKHDAGFPENAVRYCLDVAGRGLDGIDRVAFYDKPFLKFERLLETYLAITPSGFSSFARAMPVWIKEKLYQKPLLIRHLRDFDPSFSQDRLLFAEHHLSHAASAFYPSPFEDAVVLTMDGVGEWTTTSLGHGAGRNLAIEREIHFPHSLGLLYSAITYYLGFKVNSGEYKVMGLAPYGEPRFAQHMLDNLIDVKDDGSFRLDMAYFDYCGGLTMTNSRFDTLMGGPVRDPETLLDQRHMDIAASVQTVCEEVVLRLARDAARAERSRNLCLAGGVALNCVANGKLLREKIFDRVWVQPAAGDAGGAVGAALAAYHGTEGKERRLDDGRGGRSDRGGRLDGMAGAYLGPAYEQPEVERRLAEAGARFEAMEEDAMLEATAEALADGAAVGWFQGRMEFGPRALGARSILADPRRGETQRTLNLKVKYRESFRPFAPAVLAEDVSEWFEHDGESPYMLLVAEVRDHLRRAMTEEENALFGIDKLNVPRSSIPAVTHVDYSARLQTVHAETNPRFHGLLRAFKKRTGCPILVNTSFNIRGEPIVLTPEDAFRFFMGTELDVLVCGNAVLHKADQDGALARDYRDAVAPD